MKLLLFVLAGSLGFFSYAAYADSVARGRGTPTIAAAMPARR